MGHFFSHFKPWNPLLHNSSLDLIDFDLIDFDLIEVFLERIARLNRGTGVYDNTFYCLCI